MRCHVCNQVITPGAGGMLTDDADDRDRDYPLCSIDFVKISNFMLDLLNQHINGPLVACSRATCQNRVDRNTAAKIRGGYFCVHCAKIVAEVEYQKWVTNQRLDQLKQVNSPVEVRPRKKGK